MTHLIAYLQANPVFGVAVTIAAYALAVALWRRLGTPAPLHPVLVATALVATVLLATGMSYETYFSQAFVLNESLGVIIVLLAVPLYRQFRAIKQAGSPIALALIVGSVVALITALALPVATGAAGELLATLAPKSATAAVAVEIATRFGGTAALTAMVVISTGIFGAVLGPAILRAMAVEDDRAVGFALGVASHALGTARAFQISETAGAFASLGMILNALLTIALAPLALALVPA